MLHFLAWLFIMKIVAKTLLGLLVLVIFTSTALWIVTKNIKSETIQRFVANQISVLTHKESHINGAISWQLLPRPALKIQKIQIGSNHNKEEYRASIDSLVFNLKFTPLLKGNLLFNELVVDGLQLEINPDEFKKSSVINNARPNPTNSIQKEFSIQKVNLTRSKIIINKNGGQTVLKNLQVGVEDFNLGKHSFPIQIKTKINTVNATPNLKANISFTGRVTLNPTIISDFYNGLQYSPLEGQLIAQNIVFNQIQIKKISSTVKATNENIKLNPLTLSLYNGEAIGSMNYQIKTRQLSLSQTGTNLNGQELLTALLGHKTISGTMDYSLHALIPIDKITLNTLVGNGYITLKEGTLFDVNMDELLNHLKITLNQFIEDKEQNLSPLNKQQMSHGGTRFKLVNVHYQLNNEQISTDSLLIQTDKLQIKGQGLINLSTHALLSKLQIIINNGDVTMQKIQNLIGGYFPIAVSGTIDHPNVSPDLKAVNPLLKQLLITSTLQKPLKNLGKQLHNLKGFIH